MAENIVVVESLHESNSPMASNEHDEAPSRGGQSPPAVDHSGQESDGNALDPILSERRYYRDPSTGMQREIWRPGDGNGDKATDYYDRHGPPLLLEKRWRLFQSDIGYIHRKNMPPHLVILDDRAAADVLSSELPRAMLNKYWPHDFSGPGHIRVRRTHRGRPALSPPDAEGNEKYLTAPTGVKSGPLYYFTGERDYDPIVYRPLPPPPALRPKLPDPKPKKGDEDYNAREHGHNQYTPKDMMVKHGAPSFAVGPSNRNKRLHAFLTAEAPLSHAKYRRVFADPEGSARAVAQRDEVEGTVHDQSEEIHAVAGSRADASSAIERERVGHVLSNIRNPTIRQQEDVVSVATRLVRANVKTAQQAQEIERLQRALFQAQDNEQAWKLKFEELELGFARSEPSNDQTGGQ